MDIGSVDYGSKIYGKVGNASVGLLRVGQFGKDDYTVGRVRYEWEKKAQFDYKEVRSHNEEIRNTARILAGNYRLYDKRDQVVETWASYSTAGNNNSESGDGRNIAFGISGNGRPRTLGWSLSYLRITDDWDPYLGIDSDRDIKCWNTNISIRDEPQKGNVRYQSASLGISLADHMNGSLFYNSLYLDLDRSYRSGKALSMFLSGGHRPPNYDRQIGVTYSWGNNDLYKKGYANIQLGKIAGGDYSYYSIGQGWNLSDKLSVYGSYGRAKLGEPSPDAYSVSQLVGTVTYEIDAVRSLVGRFVSTSGKNNMYFAFRRRVRAGMDLYAIFGDPNAESTKSSITVKAVRPL